jgi:hypothetical protein
VAFGTFGHTKVQRKSVLVKLGLCPKSRFILFFRLILNAPDTEPALKQSKEMKDIICDEVLNSDYK